MSQQSYVHKDRIDSLTIIIFVANRDEHRNRNLCILFFYDTDVFTVRAKVFW